MRTNNDLTSDYVRECFSYNEEAGKLSWLHRPRHHFNSDATYKIFISKCADKIAGWVASDGYSNVRINGKAYRSHRIIWLVHYGEWPKFIDHINGDISDNRLLNLRNVSQLQNSHNSSRPSTNTTGYVGVAKVSKGNGYRAQIMCNGESIHLGRFATIEEAVDARIQAQIRLGFHENHGR